MALHYSAVELKKQNYWVTKYEIKNLRFKGMQGRIWGSLGLKKEGMLENKEV